MKRTYLLFCEVPFELQVYGEYTFLEQVTSFQEATTIARHYLTLDDSSPIYIEEGTYRNGTWKDTGMWQINSSNYLKTIPNLYYNENFWD